MEPLDLMLSIQEYLIDKELKANEITVWELIEILTEDI